MNNGVYNIVLAGVGGQGILLIGRILSTAALRSGRHVYHSETHGMARRGGAVLSRLRLGDDVHTPLILGGQADILIGFEPMETLRNLHYLKVDGLVISNTRRIIPAQLSKEESREYPPMTGIEKFITNRFNDAVIFDATALAEKTGNYLTMNIVLLGVLVASKVIPFSAETFQDAMAEHIPPNLLDDNKKAFELGRERYLKTKKS
jgi:indolepyruvate ferredoxin oxidoreductase beta subunit